jgi:hypothetical protein
MSPMNQISAPIKAGESETVEFETVAYFLRALRYGEGYGTGVATMLRRCEQAGIRPPLFQELGDDCCVAVYSRDYDQIHPVTG